MGQAGLAEEKSLYKVRMLLDLPGCSETLLSSFKAKLRSQVKKPLRDGLTAYVGGNELVDDFYQVFAENMRDLGSPVHSRSWIKNIVANYDDRARVGLVRAPDGKPAAGGILLLHPHTVSIPWASSLRRYNRFSPNMLLYWNFLAFAADSGFGRFDFGRSSPGEGTYRFKAQWGAKPEILDWRCYQPDGSLRPNSVENRCSNLRQRIEAIWRRMPLGVTNTLGPMVRRYVSL